MSDAILDSRVGMVDRVFGVIFGVLRGFLLVVIPYMFYQHFIPDETKHFDWVRNSQSLPYLKSTGASLQSVLVNYLPSTLTDPETPEAPTGEQPGQG